MISMDDTFERMRLFRRAVERFQDALESSLGDLERHHAAVDPVWRDDRRRAYDAEYAPLQAVLLDYARRLGPQFLDFLDEKMRALDDYLHG